MAARVEGRCSTRTGFMAASPSWFNRSLALFDTQSLTMVRSAVSCVAIQQHSTVSQAAPPPKRQKHPTSPAHVSFVGCVRNVAEHLPQRSAHIAALGSAFADYRVLIWEDGSTDTSRAQLKRWADTNPRVRLLLATGVWPGGSLGRIARIGFCRNVLLAEVLKTAEVSRPHDRRISLHAPHGLTVAASPRSARSSRPRRLAQHWAAARTSAAAEKFIISLDLDCPSVLQPATLSGAVALMSFDTSRGHPSWDMLSANSLPSYYDLYALRSTLLALDYDCLKPSSEVAARGNCFQFRVTLHPEAAVLPVDSAFNGLAIYRTAALQSARCTYGGPFISTCEHVVFHQCLRRQGLRLGIAPSLVQGCGAEHAHADIPKPNVVRLERNGTLHLELGHHPTQLSAFAALRINMRCVFVAMVWIWRAVCEQCMQPSSTCNCHCAALALFNL